jgi:hypothetical protein
MNIYVIVSAWGIVESHEEMKTASESKTEIRDLPESKQDVRREKIYFSTERYLNVRPAPHSLWNKHL